MTVTAERPSEYPVMLPGVTLTSLAAHIGDSVLRPKMPLWWWIGFLFSLSLLLVLAVACAWLFINGIGVWGVDIPVAWGLAIAEYVWWIALASGGTIVSALFYLTRSPWRAAISRIAESMMLCAAASAGIMPILHLGRPGLFYWLFPYPNVMGIWPQFRSPLLWDFVCLLCYILMSVMFYYTGLLPDLATMRDRATTRGRQILYGVLALGWRGAASQWRPYKTVYLIMAAIMAPMVVSVHSVVGLDFAGGLTPGWHSTQFPPYFFFGAVISGIALVILLTIPIRRAYRLQAIITDYHLNALGKIMLTGSLMLGFAYFWEAFGPFYGSEVAERTMFVERVFGLYAPLFWATIVLNIALPQLLWWPAVRVNEAMLAIISIAIVVGMWCERFVIVVTSLHRNHIPSEWGNYTPTLWDWATFAGSIGLFLTLFFIMLRLVPIVPLADMRELMRDKAAG
ncbi:MAG TPA: NrfD/PsrC family molybdoenzyme membrane anchor subunit [Stellaceae bacterium]|jgi:molybdopterin-containing oxidoreductase family membrane subunit